MVDDALGLSTWILQLDWAMKGWGGRGPFGTPGGPAGLGWGVHAAGVGVVVFAVSVVMAHDLVWLDRPDAQGPD